MPIYEYVCRSCSHQFEALRLSSNGFTDVVCPECGSAKAAKKLSTFAAVSVSSTAGCSDGVCPAPPMGGRGASVACRPGMCGLN